ncbi:mitochondrial fission regulator 1-like isoform X3 [Paroedura picta]|uniref:mitochondrial fission regulator 1-like isoform X3 n=1 Tax=Paroedura picta TaxID=143630 RepID=UPI0040578EAB
MTIPIWQNKPHGSSRSFVRKIGTNLPLKPCPRASFQALPNVSDLYLSDTPPVPTLADVAWIASDDEETYARVRYSIPSFHPWCQLTFPSLLKIKQSSQLVCCLPSHPGIFFWDRLSSSEAQVETQPILCHTAECLCPKLEEARREVVGFEETRFTCLESDHGTPGRAESLAESDSKNCSCRFSDITEEEAELESPELPSVSLLCSATSECCKADPKDSDDEDSVSLSKASSFADMMGILKDIHRMKQNKDLNRTLMKEEDPAILIAEVLRRKFALKDEDVNAKKN